MSDQIVNPSEVFAPFPKITRLSRECMITEKIDGTNAQICITPEGKMLVGSRTRWLTPEADNFGFASWAYANAAELTRGLAVGRHYGEWWGGKIQRGYGVADKRFSLFNAKRWTECLPPACCSVVPILYNGPFDTSAIGAVMKMLKASGSQAAPGYMNPEGIVMYFQGIYFKKTFEYDDRGKYANVATQSPSVA